MFITAQTCILKRFWNPLLSHFLSDVTSFFLLLIFNSTSIHTIFCKMTKLYTNETSFSCISFPQMMLYTIHSNVCKFSTIMTFALGVVVPTKYCFHNLFYWIQYLGFSILMTCVHVSYIFVTFSFKSWFLFAFIILMAMLIAIVAFSIEFSFPIAPTFS